MKLGFQSLEGRIATLFLALIIVLQMLGLVLIQRGIDSNARASITAELTNGEKVFRKLMEQNAQKRRFSAQVLARDTGFVQAVGNDGSGDRETIQSALENSARRARANLTMLVDGERKVKVSTGIGRPAELEKLVLGLLDQAEQSEGATGVALVDSKPYQIVVMPVKAPITIAWVVMGFAIDRQLAMDMKELSALEVAILARGPDGRWLAGDATVAPGAAGAMAAQLQGLTGRTFDVDMDGGKYSARLVDIGRAGESGASVVLARSIEEATAEYSRLERRLVVLTIVGIIVAAVASVLTAKRIAQPLRQLAGIARRLERGDYRAQTGLKRGDEIGALAKAFDSMRDGIAKREQEIRRLAYWDPLTNLPNRAQFVMLLNESLEQARKREQQVFVLMMDLDRFKHVNDVMGHSFGDDLLRQVAGRLQVLVVEAHPEAHVARLGGDEFVVLLPGADAGKAQVIAAAILLALEQPLSLDDQTVDIGAGIGIAGYPAHGADAEALLSMAEVAMYAAKQRNDGAVVYDAMIDKGSETSLSLLTELRTAIERNEFRLHVQPKMKLDTGEVVGVESLVRWVHPERGNVFPDEFIPFAEQTGFIRVLTRWVLEQSAALCRDMADKGIHLKVSVNLSTRDLLDQDLPAKFTDILRRHRVAPESFCLEITESAIMDDPIRAQQTLERLHAMGVDLSIDDFGTGYSSLAYLKRLPVDELKIDKSFVLNMENDIGDTKIVRSTIDLGHNMGLRVVAEGIESEAVWRLLAALGCDEGQGYFMSRPIPGDKLVDWIRNWVPPVRSALPYADTIS
ncbi:EAL domain-containing protein [Massilia sp. R2A-15]|uniref:putative bifunctional diguanylate cyclase/phosphodiesterase n=1 Tax=Massilia sp. R2A-15 TaxID=3064278 RepID=UPI00273603E4|nr:EAL domain-containing protein [Massilia sp. R2A-15]WLI91206.1 EAL domain-containing protein [Massilia sp. R2A-15]